MWKPNKPLPSQVDLGQCFILATGSQRDSVHRRRRIPDLIRNQAQAGCPLQLKCHMVTLVRWWLSMIYLLHSAPASLCPNTLPALKWWPGSGTMTFVAWHMWSGPSMQPIVQTSKLPSVFLLQNCKHRAILREREICPWSPMSFHSLSAEPVLRELSFQGGDAWDQLLPLLLAEDDFPLGVSAFNLAALVRGPPPTVVALVFLFMYWLS